LEEVYGQLVIFTNLCYSHEWSSSHHSFVKFKEGLWLL